MYEATAGLLPEVDPGLVREFRGFLDTDRRVIVFPAPEGRVFTGADAKLFERAFTPHLHAAGNVVLKDVECQIGSHFIVIHWTKPVMLLDQLMNYLASAMQRDLTVSAPSIPELTSAPPALAVRIVVLEKRDDGYPGNLEPLPVDTIQLGTPETVYEMRFPVALTPHTAISAVYEAGLRVGTQYGDYEMLAGHTTVTIKVPRSGVPTVDSKAATERAYRVRERIEELVQAWADLRNGDGTQWHLAYPLYRRL